ncbi:MAG: protein-L-isoaspartate O-methyltransferase [bacterium]|nr:protein-L-isoaspartate O-methyltransferase [bacterium]
MGKKLLIILVSVLLIHCNENKPETLLRKEIQKAYPGVETEILDAFFSINRACLLSGVPEQELYTNMTHAIGYGQVSSSPLLNIILAQELLIKKGDRVLEIGTGSGIQAALLEELGAGVFSMEISFELMCRTKDRLKTLGYRNIEIRDGDGYYGWPDKSARFEKILLTCAFSTVPPNLEKQLKEGGLLLMPVGRAWEKQRLIRYKKVSGNLKVDKNIRQVQFVPMIHH